VNDEQLISLMDKVAEDHASRGQTYAGGPYRKHLEDVEHLLRTACNVAWVEEESVGALLAAGILHDWFEDCFDGSHKFSHWRLTGTLIDWQGEFGVPAVSLMMALRCSDPPGMSRREAKRAILPVIVACEGARAVKLADRMANLEQSIADRNRKHLERYIEEARQLAPVADQLETPVDAVQETRHYAPVRDYLAGCYADDLARAAESFHTLRGPTNAVK